MGGRLSSMDDLDQDGCDLDFARVPTTDDEVDLFVLFADALDPLTEKTVAEAEAEWKALFS